LMAMIAASTADLPSVIGYVSFKPSPSPSVVRLTGAVLLLWAKEAPDYQEAKTVEKRLLEVELGLVLIELIALKKSLALPVISQAPPPKFWA
jgi:hypothetical protein